MGQGEIKLAAGSWQNEGLRIWKSMGQGDIQLPVKNSALPISSWF
jgi:hypothetical protein